MVNVNLETGEILGSFADFLGQRRADMSDEEYTKMLLDEDEDAVAVAKEAYKNREKIKHLIFQYMDEQGANGIPSDIFECVRKNDSSYPRKETNWLPLFDIFGKADLDKCYTPPAHGTGTWNTAQVKKLANIYGQAALDVLERTRESSTTLQFKRKEKRSPEEIAQQWEGLNKDA